MRIESGCGVRAVVPGVAIASGDNVGVCAAVVNGQMQCGHAVAPYRVGASITRSISGTSVGAVVPGVAVTGGDGLSGSGAVVDG